MSKLGEKMKALCAAVGAIEKQFGKGSIMRMGEDTEAPPEAIIPSGSIGLDLALGVGGYPRGRVIEIFGPESSGKTTLALHAIAEAQKAGGVAAFIDAEHALDVSYAKRLGVNLADLLVSQPDTGEQALEIGEQLVRSGAVDIIVVDSVAALVPRAEIEGEMGDAHMGVQARLMSQALRKLTAVVSRNQERREGGSPPAGYWQVFRYENVPPQVMCVWLWFIATSGRPSPSKSAIASSYGNGYGRAVVCTTGEDSEPDALAGRYAQLMALHSATTTSPVPL